MCLLLLSPLSRISALMPPFGIFSSGLLVWKDQAFSNWDCCPEAHPCWGLKVLVCVLSWGGFHLFTSLCPLLESCHMWLDYQCCIPSLWPCWSLIFGSPQPSFVWADIYTVDFWGPSQISSQQGLSSCSQSSGIMWSSVTPAWRLIFFLHPSPV